MVALREPSCHSIAHDMGDHTMNAPTGDRKSPSESSFCHPLAHEAFDLDVVLRALAHPSRREVLCLLDAEPEWTFDELVAAVGTVDTVPGNVSRPKAETILYHQHLPVLEHAALVEVDEEHRRVGRGENFEPIRDMVDAAVAAMPQAPE